MGRRANGSVERALRVLVLDDHADTRDMTAELLMGLGLDVLACATARAALAAVRRRPPDALLTDLHLGDESGVELARSVRAEAPGVVLVAVTGVVEPDPIARACFDEYWVKPIDVATFGARVRQLLAARGR